MLRTLSIRNIVLIDTLELEFGPAMTVLTGETGAGKSILLDALSLALGARGDGGLVRTGADQGQIIAVFEPQDGHPAYEVMRARNLETSGDLVLRRVQSRDGRTRAFINDQPVSAGLLREIGATLVEIHGQHDDRALLDQDAHRVLLDAFGGLEAEAGMVRGACTTLKQAQAELERLNVEARSSAKEADYLRASVEELTILAPEPGEEDGLAAKRQTMMHAEKIAGEVRDAYEEIAGAGSPVPAIASVVRRLERKIEQAPGLLEDTVKKLDAALAGLHGAQDALEVAMRICDHDPQELERTEERLFALRAASRKFSVPVEGLADLAVRMADQLTAIDHGGALIAQLTQQVEGYKKEYLRLAAILSERRAETARQLETSVMAELPSLKLERAIFTVAMETDPARVGESGQDQVTFFVMANPGTRAGPIAKIASGGELARILLALKVALADRGSAPTLVFDEIDTGVGGAVADAIGVRLSRLARNVQVLSVTHAPQVAARADDHLVIAKEVYGAGETVTLVEPVSGSRRKEEIARMLAGATVTEEARAAAEKLIAQSAA